MSKEKSKPNPEAADAALEDLDQAAANERAGEARNEGGALEALRAELNEARDRALRAQAELDNFRKRVRREIEEERQYAAIGLLRELLPVLDNMGRAIEAAEGSPNEGMLEGVRMIRQQFEDVLKQFNCHPIDSIGQPFDPNWHEAISMQPSNEHPPGTVIAVARQGYRLADRVVRPSQVVVAAAPPESNEG